MEKDLSRKRLVSPVARLRLKTVSRSSVVLQTHKLYLLFLDTGGSSHRAAYHKQVGILMREVVAICWIPGIHTRIQVFPNII